MRPQLRPETAQYLTRDYYIVRSDIQCAKSNTRGPQSGRRIFENLIFVSRKTLRARGGESSRARTRREFSNNAIYPTVFFNLKFNEDHGPPSLIRTLKFLLGTMGRAPSFSVLASVLSDRSQPGKEGRGVRDGERRGGWVG